MHRQHQEVNMPGDEPKRQGQVQRELELAKKEAERLYTAACELGGSLTPVLRQPEKAQADEDATAQELVPIAGEIKSIRYTIERSIVEIEDCLSRLEV